MSNKRIKAFFKYIFSTKIFTNIISVFIILIIIKFNVTTDSITSIIKFDMVISVGIVGVVSWFIQYINSELEKSLEENEKLNYDIKTINKIYCRVNKFKIYEKETPLVEILNGEKSFNISFNKPNFELDNRIAQHMSTLIGAHRHSTFHNEIIYRVDKIDIKKETLALSETEFYNTLFTNRTMDYKVNKNLTIRSLFEFGPNITSFENSKLANGLGVGIICKTSDNYYLLANQSSKNPTGKKIAGNCASRFFDAFTYEYREFYQDKENHFNIILNQSIIRGIKDKLLYFYQFNERKNHDEKSLNIELNK